MLKDLKKFLLADSFSEMVRLEQSFKPTYNPDYVRWLSYNNQEITDTFLKQHEKQLAAYIRERNNDFKTEKFRFYVSRWLSEYLWKTFNCFEQWKNGNVKNITFKLEDNPLNRYAVEIFENKFAIKLPVSWQKRLTYFQQAWLVYKYDLLVLGLACSSGIGKEGEKKHFKVLREALWGLKNYGKYFHDDFFVDGIQLKAGDVLFFSRTDKEVGRKKAFEDISQSSYQGFRLNKIPMSSDTLSKRILPKYIKPLNAYTGFADNLFSVFYSLDLNFALPAIPYEKIFCHYTIDAELGHNYFSATHIPEAIVCENHGTKYYLMHWSDFGISANRWGVSRLGCDAFLSWGSIHARGMECSIEETGFIFKKHIHLVQLQKENVKKELGIKGRSKQVVSFFDESFSGFCEMNAEHFINFWKAAYELAKKNPEIAVVIKPKNDSPIDSLKGNNRERFQDLLNQITLLPNATILKSTTCSFIEVMGISDIVVTQGMTSSSTIAIISGINGLYLDEVGYDHPFSRDYQQQIVFKNGESLNNQIRKILDQQINPLANIPLSLIRQFDACPDDSALNRFVAILSGKTALKTKKKIGIIMQARMGSSRLPGKVMKLIQGKPMLTLLLERLKKAKAVDQVIVATTDKAADDIIVLTAKQAGVDVFRGDEDHVLSRYYGAAKQFGLDVIIRITSDCPLMDPALIDKMVADFNSTADIDYMSNVITRTYPRGFDIEIFTKEALVQAYERATEKEQTEHVTPYIVKHGRKKNYPAAHDHSEFRVTVDTSEDFALIEKIFEQLGGAKNTFTYEDVIHLLVTHPKLAEINRHIVQKTS